MQRACLAAKPPLVRPTAVACQDQAAEAVTKGQRASHAKPWHMHILCSITGKKKAHLPRRTGLCIVNADPMADQNGMSSSMSSKPLAGRAACGWAMGCAAGGWATGG